MNDQHTTIETFQTDVAKVTTDLAEAKKLTDEVLQKSQAESALLKAETLADQIKTAKEEANTKLKALEGKTDTTSQAEIKKIEKEINEYTDMLSTLDSTKTELTILKVGVTIPSTSSEVTPPENQEENKEDDKVKNRNRIQRQRDGVTNKEEWKTNT